MLARVSTSQCNPTKLVKRSFDKQADLFKVLSDPHRVRILAAIAQTQDEVCVCDLTAGLPLEQPTVSHHLRVLRTAGLVTSERRGTWVYYRLAPEAKALLADAVSAILDTKSTNTPSKRLAS